MDPKSESGGDHDEDGPGRSKRLQQDWILREVGENAQLDLRVVSGDELEARRRDKRVAGRGSQYAAETPGAPQFTTKTARRFWAQADSLEPSTAGRSSP